MPLKLLPCIDSLEIARKNRNDLDIPRDVAAELGRSADQAVTAGFYVNGAGENVDISSSVRDAISRKISIPPDAALPTPRRAAEPTTQVSVVNATTLEASRSLIDEGYTPLALNFANGVNPGGGFLSGARAQEEALCRSSALYRTLVGDDMYAFHSRRPTPDSTDWAILSPDVPVFRTDKGDALDRPWPLSVISSAAPYAPVIGQAKSRGLLRTRIHRILEIAAAYEYRALVLGAWGCGAFGNDAHATARDFRRELEIDFEGAFSRVVFAVTDWSPDRRFLGPFRDVFYY